MKHSVTLAGLIILLFILSIITPLTFSYSTEPARHPNKIVVDLRPFLQEYQSVLYQDAQTFKQWTHKLYHQYGQNLIQMLADKTSELSLNFDSDVLTNAAYLNKVAQGKINL